MFISFVLKDIVKVLLHTRNMSWIFDYHFFRKEIFALRKLKCLQLNKVIFFYYYELVIVKNCGRFGNYALR